MQTNSFDWSRLTQVSVVWHTQNDWSLGGQFVHFFGSSGSEYDSTPVGFESGAYVGRFFM
jgi:hypothetical protein